MASAATLRVYDDYGEAVPNHPGAGWTRFVCISDTHSQIYPIPPGDVLLCAGDLSSWGTPSQLQVTIDWFKGLRSPATKILIAGNHDLCLDRKWAEGPNSAYSRLTTKAYAGLQDVDNARAMMHSAEVKRAGLYYLEHGSMVWTAPSGKQWKFWGSPAAPRYAPGSFQYQSADQAIAIYAPIPTDTEILLTHTPSYYTLDRTKRGKHAGCPQLAAKMKDLRACRLHVFGHIHESHGAKVQKGIRGVSDRVSVNAAVAWGGQAVIVDLKDE